MRVSLLSESYNVHIALGVSHRTHRALVTLYRCKPTPYSTAFARTLLVVVQESELFVAPSTSGPARSFIRAKRNADSYNVLCVYGPNTGAAMQSSHNACMKRDFCVLTHAAICV